MSSLAVVNTMPESESLNDIHYFIAFIIPFLPFVDDKEDDDDKLTEDDILSIQSHPTYVMNKRLFGTELEGNQEYVINFDDMVMRMIHIYLKKIKIHEDDTEIGGKKGGRKKGGRKKVGGGGFEEILKDKKKMFAMLQFVFGIFLLYIGISKFIDVQNRSLLSTPTPVKLPSTSDMGTASASTDDMVSALALPGTREIDMGKQIMFPEINLAKEVNQQIKSVTVKELLAAVLGYETKIYAKSLMVLEIEATKQAAELQQEFLKINLPIIQKEAAQNFLNARGSSIVLETGDVADIKKSVFDEINNMPLTDRIFNYYKFSFTGSFSDLVRATRSAVISFKKKVVSNLDIQKDDALFKAESFIIDTLRQGVTSIQVIFVGLTLLATAYGTVTAKNPFPKEEEEWNALTDEAKEMWRERLEKLLDNRGPPVAAVADNTRSQKVELHGLLGDRRGGRKRRRKKTRKKGRKTRRKSKKRKTKRRRKRKRKTKRRKRRR